MLKNLTAIILISLFQPTAMPSLSEDSHDKTASQFLVESMELDKSIYNMMLLSMQRTTTYNIMANELSANDLRSITKKHVKESAEKYRTAWANNLAEVYTAHFSKQELLSLAKEKQESPFWNKLLGQQLTIGTDMKQKSETILGKATAEALEKMFNEYSSRKKSKQ